MIEDTEKISKWNELKLYFIERTKSPWEHPEFILYFLLVVLGFGATGIWSSFFITGKESGIDHANMINNIASFSVAIIAAGSIELMFSENKIIKSTLSLLTVALLFLSFILFIILFNTTNVSLYLLAIPFGLIAIYTWWVANADNANLTENFFKEQSEKSKDLSKTLDRYDGE